MLTDAADTARTGLPELDAALGGLYWGDNVVWTPGEHVAAEPFYRAVAAVGGYGQSLYVCLERDPAAIAAAYPGFAIVDARPGSPLEHPAPLLAELSRRCDPVPRSLLLFDALDGALARWGGDLTRAFFVRCCPHLLEIGAVAYWTLGHATAGTRLLRAVEEVTQCVLALDGGRLRIAKAEGRGPGVEGTIFRYGVRDGGVTLTPAPAATRVGTALRALRVDRGLSQSELARLLGISPSAVSQAERGRRGLSLETLLTLCAKLDLTLDELLRGEVAAGYRLARRHDPRQRATDRPLALLDDRRAGMRAYLVRLPAHRQGTPHLQHKGVELVAVATGLVQVVLGNGRPVLRPGETLLADGTAITGWRNLGEAEATLFWVLRD